MLMNARDADRLGDPNLYAEFTRSSGRRRPPILLSPRLTRLSPTLSAFCGQPWKDKAHDARRGAGGRARQGRSARQGKRQQRGIVFDACRLINLLVCLGTPVGKLADKAGLTRDQRITAMRPITSTPPASPTHRGAQPLRLERSDSQTEATNRPALSTTRTRRTGETP